MEEKIAAWAGSYITCQNSLRVLAASAMSFRLKTTKAKMVLGSRFPAVAPCSDVIVPYWISSFAILSRSHAGSVPIRQAS